VRGYYSEDYRRRAGSRSNYTTQQTQVCGCGCKEPQEMCEVQMVPAMAFIYFQPDIASCDVYDCCAALQRGTLFAGLDKPFMGKSKGGSCR